MNKLKKIVFIIILFIIICQFFTLPAVAVDGTPKLIILSPPDGIYTNVSSIQITGESEPGAVLTINGTNIPNNNGSFSWNLSLSDLTFKDN